MTECHRSCELTIVKPGVSDNCGLIATCDQLKALLRLFADGDDRRFYSVAMQLAAHEARQGHSKLPKELRHLIDSALPPGHTQPPLLRD